MAKKSGFTMDQHQEWGRRLFRVHDDLVRLYVDVANHYPVSVGRAGRTLQHLDKMQHALSTVRSELEELMAAQYPGEWKPSIYYGGPLPECPCGGQAEFRYNRQTPTIDVWVQCSRCGLESAHDDSHTGARRYWYDRIEDTHDPALSSLPA